jgi:hypothetical protein
MFDLARNGKGMTIDLLKAPDWILRHILKWHNEAVEEQNRKNGPGWPP